MRFKPQSDGILGWLCLASVAYLLGVGPAARFGFGSSIPAGMCSADFVGKVWQPILALDNTKARPIYRAYMQLWGVRYYEPDW